MLMHVMQHCEVAQMVFRSLKNSKWGGKFKTQSHLWPLLRAKGKNYSVYYFSKYSSIIYKCRSLQSYSWIQICVSTRPDQSRHFRLLTIQQQKKIYAAQAHFIVQDPSLKIPIEQNFFKCIKKDLFSHASQELNCPSIAYFQS